MKNGNQFSRHYFSVGLSSTVKTQTPEMPAYHPGQLEAMAEKNNAEPTDDSDLTGSGILHWHPLNLNMAREEDLDSVAPSGYDADQKFSIVPEPAGFPFKYIRTPGRTGF